MKLKTPEFGMVGLTQSRDYQLTRGLLIILASIGSCLFPAIARAQPSKRLRTITRIVDAHSLSAVEAARSYPVHFQAVVTYYDPHNDGKHALLFIHDHTGSIFAFLTADWHWPGAQPHTGSLVDVTGVTAPGDFASAITETRMEVIGESRETLFAKPVSFTHLSTGIEDAQYVQIEGVVHSVIQSEHWVTLNVAMSDGMIAAASMNDPNADYRRLIDSKVVIQGNVGTLFNENRQMVGTHLLFPDLNSVEIEDAAPPSPFSLPSRSIVSLSRYTPTATLTHRVHVRGTVTLQWPGTMVCIQDQTSGICAKTADSTQLKLGQIADVTGFVVSGGYRPMLADSVFKSLGEGLPVEAARVTATETLKGNNDSELVQIEGKLIGRDLTSNQPTLLLSSQGYIFPVVLPKGNNVDQFANIRIGSTLRIDGICSVVVNAEQMVTDSGHPTTESFRILARSRNDVTVLEAPPWWTPERTMFGFALALSLSGVVVVWGAIMRRRVEQQTAVIRDSNRVVEYERAMLRALIDNIPDCMYVKDAEGAFVLANLQMARMLGFEDPQLLIGKTDHAFYPKQLADGFRSDEVQVMHSGLCLSEHEEDGIDTNGNVLAMMTTKVPIRDTKGLVSGIAGIGRDISERKKSEAALREAERKYRNMFDEALVGICKVGLDGRLLQVNPAMAESLRYASPSDMVSGLAQPLWDLAVSDKLRSEFKTAIENTGYIRAFEFEMLRKDGTTIWVSSSVRTQHEDGITVGYVGMFEDISEHRKLREQLLQAQKLESVGQLAAGIAHEINTPVQYIGDNVRFLRDIFDELVVLNGAYAQLLSAVQQGVVSPEFLQEMLQSVRAIDAEYLFSEIPQAIAQTLEGVSRVASLVCAMKEFSHPGTGEKVSMDLNRAIESTITVARNEWKYVADLNTDLDATLPLVSCLPGEFNQVVLNLIVNAAHAIGDVAAAGGPAKGLITIQTLCLAECAEIRIQDTGGGIPETVRTRIFDPFFTTKEIGKGTGQGLAIARSVVVDKHQGSIGFETELGRGTTFIIRLPFDERFSSLSDRSAA